MGGFLRTLRFLGTQFEINNVGLVHPINWNPERQNPNLAADADHLCSQVSYLLVTAFAFPTSHIPAANAGITPPAPRCEASGR